LATPDLDLMKQKEQGQALGLRWREDDEFVRPQFFAFAGKKRRVMLR
jgi:hypothetical protein